MYNLIKSIFNTKKNEQTLEDYLKEKWLEKIIDKTDENYNNYFSERNIAILDFYRTKNDAILNSFLWKDNKDNKIWYKCMAKSNYLNFLDYLVLCDNKNFYDEGIYINEINFDYNNINTNISIEKRNNELMKYYTLYFEDEIISTNNYWLAEIIKLYTDDIFSNEWMVYFWKENEYFYLNGYLFSIFVMARYNSLIEKFFEITERKVSIIDDYWDENWNELNKQIDTLLNKILEKEKSYEYKIPYQTTFFDNWVYLDLNILKQKLAEEFRKYHEEHKQKHINFNKDSIAEMTWVDFEVYLSKKFTDLWYEVAGTPTTWDQWADLIIKKNWKKIIIQAKRFTGSVWNKAVQEVVWAMNYYKGDDWYVITNSYFTNSAKALAQKSNVKLIDWHDLKNLELFF